MLYSVNSSNKLKVKPWKEQMDVAWLTTGLSAAEKPGHINPVLLNQWEIGICAADFVCDSL